MPYSNEPTPAELVRYRSAEAAAAHPLVVMETIGAIFRGMVASRKEGDHDAVRQAAAAIADQSLRLCAVPAADDQAAGEKARFLVIISKWAWTRRPALAAVMDAAVRAECRTWGDRIMR